MKSLERKRFYESLDWTKADADLAREIGRSRSVVGTWRRKLGKPQVEHVQIRRHQNILLEAKGWRWQDGISKLSARHKMSRQWLYRIGRRIGAIPEGGR